MQLKGATAIVTGGGTGIGRAVCLDLARAGVQGIVVNYSRSGAEAESTVSELAALGATAVAVKADVSREAEVRDLVALGMERFGRLDVLINNAGTTRFIPIGDLDAVTDEVWQAILGVNLLGPWYAARAAAPHLKAAHGCIVNVASIAGLRASGSSLPYGVSKAALTHLTSWLAMALAPEVRVNAVNPGRVSSRWFRQPFGEEAAAAQDAASAERTPLRRVVTPEDVSQAVMGFIASDAVTGQHLVVDGGVSIGY
ncbi:MAG TPA: SDR family oxidoreductase [Candidatus Dormibacteraeota bacterium]|nr:SDR family oxidoreductase [Candidatus Dormibacteraeota bacterium]